MNHATANPDQQALRMIYMGTPEFAVPALHALCDLSARINGRVVAVVTQPDRPAGRNRKLMPSPVKVAALQQGLPVLQPERLRKNLAAIQALAELKPAVIIVAAYGLILPKAVLEIPAFGCVNLHASLLPAYRGASPIAAALLDGLTETGVSIMLMDEGMDTGPVLTQAVVSIKPYDTSASLTATLAQRGADLLLETLPGYLEGRITPIPQSELPGEVSLCGRIQKEDGRIDWSCSAATIERMTRAYAPWPGAYTTWQGAPFKIIRAEALTTPPELAASARDVQAGTVLRVDRDGKPDVVVQTGEGRLRLHQVQPAGKRAMDIGGFLNGAPTFIGATLGK